ncbi:DUF2927 domain-containing protein [Roseinatronobacter alkalisoli]|uniref:DUF2927 domain-containing protein n=1 Tax=Roseinatronobacter alkalisoli TaxID=3028235 RepID=A0ABT5T8R7_9RHOB|nr:DUF2927 domain-containing protein [Roseinatronobacter sp. HJB301]MDD7970323.1 DUF2927 domain-containing protein [Roseinatronobacter sp. HJB301]
MMRAAFALACAGYFLAGCGMGPPAPAEPPTDLSLQTRAISSQALFGPPRPFAPARSNAQIAQDILELGFRLESGREIPQFSRFDGPVTLSLQGQIPPLGVIETDRLITRLQREAGLDIRRVPEQGQIVVEFVPRATLRRVVPDAACFVLPNVASWDAFRADPRAPALDWTRIARRTRALVIAPADSTVQDMRDCLHEEIAQALGPLNDLFRIGETVWNDDNLQTVLTGFDMLVLRVWNDPALQPGMTRAQVAERLPALLARHNPGGASAALPLDRVPTPRAWTEAIESALGGRTSRASFRAAQRALAIALEQGWKDERLAFSLFLSARFAPREDGAQALDAMLLAARIYNDRPGTEAHRAHIYLHLSAQALASGQHNLVLHLTDTAMSAARRTENGALLASLMLLRAQSLEHQGRRDQAENLRRDAVPFALFGFGSERAVDSRREEIAALAQRN